MLHTEIGKRITTSAVVGIGCKAKNWRIGIQVKKVTLSRHVLSRRPALEGEF